MTEISKIAILLPSYGGPAVFAQRILPLILSAVLGSIAVAQSAPARSTPLLTAWGAEVTYENVHAEYPRPTFARSDWLNLNGYWDWKDGIEQQKEFTRKILVPFPVESVLSGIAQYAERCTYRRTFTIPKNWKEDDLIFLHFGAVDWESTVFINGQEVGSHRGGYDSFSFDITSHVRRNEPNELMVQVFDPSQNGQQPRGKQSTSPSGIWYTSSTGIWQTVWLEPVPVNHIKTLQIHADINTGVVAIVPAVNAAHKDLTLMIEAFDGKETVNKSFGGSDGTPLTMRFGKGELKPWSPDSPHLYQIRIQLLNRDAIVDRVDSYFAFRKIEAVRHSGGAPAVYLNDNRLFLMGITDQGYWPDGLYTAPSDRALLTEIRLAKLLGFNVIRKYQKIEPERWYFACDQLGILVWQDMPGGENRSQASQQQFKIELQRMVQSRMHHPSIITWTIFNEGGGQHGEAEYVALLRRLDPTRLINATSGWTDRRLGDFTVSHKFLGPEMPQTDARRAAIIGLFGGLALDVAPEHRWTEHTWGHQNVTDSFVFVKRYEQMHEELRRMIQTQGLAGAFFHQLTDIETECNGLTPYDRSSIKVSEKAMEQINRETISLGSK